MFLTEAFSFEKSASQTKKNHYTGGFARFLIAFSALVVIYTLIDYRLSDTQWESLRQTGLFQRRRSSGRYSA
jgi:hypothetical protein